MRATILRPNGSIFTRDPHSSLHYRQSDGMLAIVDSAEMGTFVCSLYQEMPEGNFVYEETCTLVFDTEHEALNFAKAGVRAMSQVEELATAR